VERRREPRFHLNQPARITVLRDPKPVLEGLLLNISGRGMRIALPTPVPVGTPLKIEIGDTLFLAEVAYTTHDAGSVQAGLKVDQVLSGLSELMRLHQSLLREQTTPSPREANPNGDVILPLDAAP
jgi:hypothetical protein